MKHHTLKWAGVITILAFLAVSCGGNGDPPPGIDRSGLGAAFAEPPAVREPCIPAKSSGRGGYTV